MAEYEGMTLEELENEKHQLEDLYCSTKLALIRIGIRLTCIDDAINAQKKLEEKI